MKVTWRAKAQAYKMQSAGHEDIDIHRGNRIFYVYLSEIIDASVGTNLNGCEYPEYLLCNLDSRYWENRFTFRDLMKF